VVRYDNTPYNPTEARISDKIAKASTRVAQARIHQRRANNLVYGEHIWDRKFSIERRDLFLQRHRECVRTKEDRGTKDAFKRSY
jgi:hypothetical protein